MKHQQVEEIASQAKQGSRLRMVFNPLSTDADEDEKEAVVYALNVLNMMHDIMGMIELTQSDYQLVCDIDVELPENWENEETRSFEFVVRAPFNHKKFAHDFYDQIQSLEIVSAE